uniref:Fibronectin type III domain containing 7 n=1 Tax=Anas platyrhynchos platyrhynchos TaxID=8840 RepID=A0A493TVF6_ANAPP
MCGSKSRSLVFLGLVCNSLEMVFSSSTAPDIPVIDQAYSKLSNSITVEWRVVPGATSYLLSAQDGDSCIETTVTNSPGTVMGLKPATSYRITIRSINAGGKSQPSPSRKAKTGGLYFYFKFFNIIL